MATNDSNEFDPIPGYTKPTHEYGTEFGDEFHAPKVVELLQSYHGFTQFGVTLAGGQGVIPTGCALGKQTANGKYYVYSAAASDGTQNFAGFLRNARDTGGSSSPAGLTSKDCLGNIVISGLLNLSVISGTDTVSLIAGTAGGVGSSAAGATSGGGIVTQAKARFDGTVANGYFRF
jgi:Bacteriophage lambda head decoration protein D